MDNLSKEQRKYTMSRVKSGNTKAELKVRSLLHNMGFRFRIHRTDLPGKPDIVLPKYKTVIFVHGCFWHRHENCKHATVPQTNVEYWQKKFQRNVARDIWVQEQLDSLGWNVLVVWECELKDIEELRKKLENIRHLNDSFIYKKVADDVTDYKRK